jgi:hypothetical protein
MMARPCTLLLGLLLSGCSSTGSPVYVPPSPPSEKAVASAVAVLAKDAGLVGPLEISAVRPNDHGPGSYFICVKEVSPPADKPRRYYAAFFDDEAYKGSRLSVIIEQCELQTYSPAPAAPSPEAPAAKGTRSILRSR